MHSNIEVSAVLLSQEQKQWLLSLSGHLSMQNGYSLDSLVNTNKNYTQEGIIRGNQSVLKNAYGVNSKEDLINTFDAFCNTNRSQHFMMCMAEHVRQDLISKRYHVDRDQNENRGTELGIMLGWGERHKTYLARCGIRAFDIGRYAFLCRCGVTVGLITEDEAWYYLARIGKVAQPLFTNWQEFATSYIVGRCVWLEIETKDYDFDSNFNFRYDVAGKVNDAAQDLKMILSDDDHPWCQLNWEIVI
ncbi:DUF1266 domain-containing protein [Pseudocolwellia sp. HL-MZ19]|uniref:DUF1266 domain-containing protein n=1 Tax=Pseudocolwellia sp. HL-MZ19 TaxID=3400846 RepID=UPI003CEE057B